MKGEYIILLVKLYNLLVNDIGMTKINAQYLILSPILYSIGLQNAKGVEFQ